MIILLAILYVLFLSGGLMVMKAKKFSGKEKAIYIGITTLGGILWFSIIVRRPLDLNKAIAWMFNL
ncbi:hypothetical protein [Cohnella luojiensis]|uniref:Uncharacterized protein n=1 Tax=Cohnella luojiensis TaxID=652876 RepID=A0A4Y8LWR9_9BACL|nr:hypothetical protein [Cohnella luojiensis]TFE26274.1 hypothetical protein E2980_11680 [Cohnella luojiensis]